MTSVITGDIIKSRLHSNPEVWLQPLKKALTSLNTNTNGWEIYRGDSFQLELQDISSCFNAVMYLKASIKFIKGLDVRLAIGVGEKTFSGNKISESNGEVFQFSGETLEEIKKEKTNLKIKTTNKQFNREMNLYFRLALIAMDNWTPNSAEIVKITLEQPGAIQKELAKHIGISQNTVSERQKRAHLSELLELDQMYRSKIAHLL